MVNIIVNLKKKIQTNKYYKKKLPFDDYDKNDFREHNPVAHGHCTYTS